MRNYSPEWVIEKLIARRTAFEKLIEARVGAATSTWPFNILLLLFVTAGSIFLYSMMANKYISFKLEDRLLLFYTILSVFTILAISVSQLFPARYLAFIYKVATLFVVLTFAFFSTDYTNLLYMVIFFISSRLILKYSFSIARKFSFQKKFFVTAFICITILNLVQFLIYADADLMPLNYMSFHRMIFLLYLPLLEFHVVSKAQESDQIFNFQIWHPVHVFYPLPTRTEYWTQKKNAFQITGLFDVIIGFIYLYFLYLLRESYFTDSEKFNGTAFVANGFITYIKIYLLSSASICIPVGLLRIGGFNMPSPFLIPLLASSPAERWRRWNTYFFNFYNWAIFLPLFRKFGSLFIAIFLTFFFTAFMHISSNSFFNFVPMDNFSFFADQQFMFFSLHALAVYFSLTFKSKAFNGKSLWGWLGVFITWGVMILIHTFKI